MKNITTLQIEKGIIDVCYVFEVGESINLGLASAFIEGDSRRQIQTKKRSSERYFGYDPAPLISVEITDPFIFESLVSDRSLEYTIFDFGVVLTRYQIPLPSKMAFESLVGVSSELGLDERLELDARNRLSLLFDRIKPAIVSPCLEDLVQGYFLYELESFVGLSGGEVAPVIDSYAGIIAQILRQETEELSEDVISEVFEYKFSYTPSDITIIDWDGAIRIGKESRDILGVIEFALVQLLEMMYLDESIDDHHDAAYQAFSRNQVPKGFGQSPLTLFGKLRGLLSGKLKTSQGALAQLTVDSTNLAMNVTNAINLIGDPTLVRIYELASARFRLRDLELNIEKKIRVLEGIYQKYTDRSDARRELVLELIIVFLITFEIIQSAMNYKLLGN